MTTAQRGRMEYLVKTLNDACQSYYRSGDEPPMTDWYYDKLSKELVQLEAVTGETFPDSPTIRVGYPVLGHDKVPHRRPVLSLKDTKSVDELLHFLGEWEGVLSWKLDGISLVLQYMDGKLINALTRGDGAIGKMVLENVLRMRDVPKHIEAKGEIVVRGEGCLSLSEFEQIKQTKAGERFSNPRNLAAGIINTTVVPSILLRHMSFVAHSLVLANNQAGKLKTRLDQLAYLGVLGFYVVPHTRVYNFELKRMIENYTNDVQNFPFPVDGLVLSINDVEYGESLGVTAKFPKHSMAFKWPDEAAFTTVRGMKWSVSQTGLITPVVIFDPVQLEGTEVKQANLHNLKFFEGLAIGKGDKIRVYKANKIIPEVEENFTRSGTEEYPRTCPVCGNETTVVTNDKTRKLYCYACGGQNKPPF